MNLNKIILCGSIGLLVLIIAVSGCTSFNQVHNKTFSNGGITFQYPGTWSNNTTFNYAQTPSSQWAILGQIGDNTTSVSISSTKLTNSSLFSTTTIESLARLDYSTASSSGLKVLSFNSSTSNNITFYELIYTSTDSVSGQTYKNYKLYFGKEGNILYGIIFKTKENDFQNQYQVMKEIQSSIKYT